MYFQSSINSAFDDPVLGSSDFAIAAAADGIVYRTYNPNNGTHNFTTARAEQDYLTAIGWNDEGVGFNVD